MRAVLFFVLVVFSAPSSWEASLHAAEYSVVPRISLRGQYNDNIFFDARGGDCIGDASSVVAPGLGIGVRTETLDARVDSRVEQTCYNKESDLDGTDQFHTCVVSWHISERFRVFTEALYARDSQKDRDLEETGLVVGTQRRERSRYSGSAAYLLSEGSSMSTSYSYEKSVFDDPAHANSSSHEATLTYSHSLDAFIPESSARLTGGIERYEYPDETITGFSLMAGFGKSLTETAQISLDAGSYVVRPHYEFTNPLVEENSARGFMGMLSATCRGRNLTSHLAVSRRLGTVIGESGAVRRTSIRYSLSRQFCLEAAADISVEFHRNTQERRLFSSDAVDEDTLWIQPRLVYTFSGYLQLEAAYRYTWIHDREEDQTVDQNRFSLGFTWQYPLVW